MIFRLTCLLVAGAMVACANEAERPLAKPVAAASVHVGVPVALDGSASASRIAEHGGGLSLAFRWSVASAPAGSAATVQNAALANATFVPDLPGDYSVRLVVSDGALESDPATVSFRADDACRPAASRLVASPAAPALGQDVALSWEPAPTCSEPQAAKLVAWRWSFVSVPAGSAATIRRADTATPSFVPDVRGIYVVRAAATNALGLTTNPDEPSAVLDVASAPCGDNPPVVKSLRASPDAPNAGRLVQLVSEVEHADLAAPCSLPRTLRYEWSAKSLPRGALVELNSGTIANPSFIPDVPGAYVFSLSVIDDLGHRSAPSELAVNVSNCGAGTPSARIAAPALATSGTTVSVSATIADPDVETCGLAPAYAFRWTLGVPGGSRARLDAPARASPTFTPDVAGTYSLGLVVVSDNGHESAPAQFDVVVGACGTLLPVAQIAAPAGAGTGSAFLLSALVEDPNVTCRPGAPYSYAWRVASRPGGGSAALAGAAADGSSTRASPSFSPDRAGDYGFELVVTDRNGLRSRPASALVTVADCTAPLTVAVDALDGVANGLPAQLSARIVDPNEPGPASSCQRPVLPFSYAWRLVAQPAGSRARIGAAYASKPSFVPDVAGPYEVELTVTDAAGNRGTSPRARLLASECSAPPTVSIDAPAGAATGAAVRLSALVVDPNTPSAQNACRKAVAPYAYWWSLSARPAGSNAALNATDLSAPSFVPDVAGEYQLQLVVVDAAGNRSATAGAVVSVSECRAPPTVKIVSPSGVVSGRSFGLSAEVRNPNAPGIDGRCTAAVAPYAFEWAMLSKPPSSSATLSAPRSAAPSIVADVAGTYSFRLVVVDAAGNRSAPAVADVVAGDCLVPLTARITAPAGAATGAAVALAASFSDPNDPTANPACGAAVAPYDYRWSLVGRPSGSRAALNSSGASSPSFTPDVAGSYTVTLELLNAVGVRSNTATADVIVADCAAPLTVAASVTGSGRTGVPAAFTAAITNPNASCGGVDPYAYRWSLESRPEGSAAVLNGASVASPSLVPDLPGTYVVAVDVSDASGRSGRAASVAYVASWCSQPFLVKVVAPAGGITGGTLPLGAEVADPNDAEGSACAGVTSSRSYHWSIVRAPAGSTASVNAPNAVTPAFVPDLAGAYEVELTVSAADGTRAARASAQVLVEDCSGGPSVVIDDVAGASTGVPVPLTATISNASSPACGALASPYTYAWRIDSAPLGSRVALNDARVEKPSLVPDLAGTYVVSLVVTDTAGRRSAVAARSITVASCGAPPGAIVTAPASAFTGTPVPLAATVTDPNDPATNAACLIPVEPFVYAWRLVEQPAGSQARIDVPAGVTPSFTPDVAGAYVVGLVVTDAAGNVGTLATATVAAVGCGAPPVVSFTATQVRESFLLAAQAVDPNPVGCGASAMTYAWSLVSAPVGSRTALELTTGSSTSFTPDAVGPYVVSLKGTNALGVAATSELSITAPACGAGPAVAVTSTAAPIVGQTVSLSALVTDGSFAGCGTGSPATAAPYVYRWTIVPPAGSRAIVAGTEATGSFVPDVPGTYAWSVAVIDAFGLTGSASGTVNVVDCRWTPAITASPAGVVQTFSPVQLTATATAASAACSNTFTTRWSITRAPAGSRAKLVSATARQTNFTPDVASDSWTVRLDVTDALTGAVTTASATITSNACGLLGPVAAPGIALPFPIRQVNAQPDPLQTATAAYLPGYILQLDATGGVDTGAACAGPLKYLWSVYARPATSTAAPAPANAAKPSFTPDQPGDYVLRLVVSNGRYVSPPSFLRIAVESPLNDLVSGVPNTRVMWNDSAVDPADGKPSIAFYQLNAATNRYDLKFTKCTANCEVQGASATWSTATIDTSLLDPASTYAPTGQVSLLYLAPGTPAVAYRSEQSCGIFKYAVFSGGAWRVSNIEANVNPVCNSIHGEIDLVLVGASNTPAVAYHTHNPGTAAKYAVCKTGCSTGTGVTWAFQLIDNSGNDGHYLSLSVDPVSKLPRVAYQQDTSGFGTTTGNLKYATCANGTGSCALATGTWSVKVINNSGGTQGFWNSIAIAPNGNPSIAYLDTSSGGRVTFATCTANCGTGATSTWSFSAIETGVGTGAVVPRLQFDASGLARISYINTVNRNLRYAVQTAAGGFTLFDIDRNVDDGHSSFILTAAGSAHVSYALTTGLKYYPFGD